MFYYIVHTENGDIKVSAKVAVEYMEMDAGYVISGPYPGRERVES